MFTLAPSVFRSVTTLGGLAPGAVIDAQFHPLSDAHVFVLSRDGLRAYDIRGGGAAAPSVAWLFPPGSLGGSAPTAFAFGAARGWELFAVFVLAESGALSYLTPVLPPGVLLPAADWNELRSDLAAADAAPAPVNVRASERWRLCSGYRLQAPDCGASSPTASSPGRICRGCTHHASLAGHEL